MDGRAMGLVFNCGGGEVIEKMSTEDFGISYKKACEWWWVRYAEGCTLFTEKINQMKLKMIKAGKFEHVLTSKGEHYQDFKGKKLVPNEFIGMIETQSNIGWFHCPFIKNQKKCPFYKPSEEVKGNKILFRIQGTRFYLPKEKK